MSSRPAPAHVLGDVIDTLVQDGYTYFLVLLRTTAGDVSTWIPAQYVVVGDELDDLYPELEENDE